MPNIKVEISHDELKEAIEKFVKEKTGLAMKTFTIKTHPGDYQGPETYKVEVTTK